MLSWTALNDLCHAEFEIGSHGHRHIAADLNSVPMVEMDARTSKITLEDHLSASVSSFAYPFGYHSAAAQRAIRRSGFAQACVVGDLPARSDDALWALPRLQVKRNTTPDQLIKLVRWAPSKQARLFAHTKQRLWRAGRRWAGWGPPEAREISPSQI
jgi:hypothetical protein